MPRRFSLRKAAYVGAALGAATGELALWLIHSYTEATEQVIHDETKLPEWAQYVAAGAAGAFFVASTAVAAAATINGCRKRVTDKRFDDALAAMEGDQAERTPLIITDDTRTKRIKILSDLHKKALQRINESRKDKGGADMHWRNDFDDALRQLRKQYANETLPDSLYHKEDDGAAVSDTLAIGSLATYSAAVIEAMQTHKDHSSTLTLQINTLQGSSEITTDNPPPPARSCNCFSC